MSEIELTIILFVGFLAGILMFSGDMLLYYDKKDYVSDGTFNPVIEIMKNVSYKRLYAGGLIGPIAAFLYCAGYYHMVLITNSEIFISDNRAADSFRLYSFGVDNSAGLFCDFFTRNSLFVTSVNEKITKRYTYHSM